MCPSIPVAIGLGSNLGERLGALRSGVAALRMLLARPSCSSVYESAPMYMERQPAFLNACLVGETRLGPEELLSCLQKIEREAGRRTGGVRFGPRELDIDLLLFEDRVIAGPELHVPHPRMLERPFVLWPLAEVAGDWVHPETGRTIGGEASRLSRGRLRLYASPAALEDDAATTPAPAPGETNGGGY